MPRYEHARAALVDLAAVKMDFHYDDWFPKEPNVGYKSLISDVMIGDRTLFMRADMVSSPGASYSRCQMPGRPKRLIFPITIPAATARKELKNCWRVME